MHTLNIDAARKHSLLEIGPPTGGGTSTPYSLNTPDILNTLMNITANPFFDPGPADSETGNGSLGSEPLQTGEEDRKVFATLEAPSASPSAPNAPASIIVSPSQPPSSVQSLRSQFIKDSLKMTIQSKRKSSGKTELDLTSELLEPKVKRREEVDSPTSFYSYSIESPNKVPLFSNQCSFMLIVTLFVFLLLSVNLFCSQDSVKYFFQYMGQFF
jgi:hypothetical protein